MSGARKILHIDMDAFYASVEQRDCPEYRGRPVIVGGDPARRGVVAAASYEAREYGVHSAMPAARAQRLCPQAVFLRPRFDAYRRASEQIQAIFRDYTAVIEPLSLDEAYLDVSDCPLFDNSATRIAADIKRRIRSETQLTASAGVSYNKFLAKIASDMNKPDGLCVVTPEQGAALAAALPIGRFHGIGKATESRMNALGIQTGADLLTWPLERLQRHFGRAAAYYLNAAQGIDERPVVSHRERKSIGAETTFAQDLSDTDEMLDWLRRLAAEVAGLLSEKRLAARTVVVKVRYDNFELVTRSRTVPRPLQGHEEITELLPGLLARTEAGARRVRLLGVTASGLAAWGEQPTPEPQLALF
jgi:DNA polymerase IV